ILAGWVDELEVPIYRARDVTGFAQDDTGVDVKLSDGQTLRAHYLVGCDGGRSLIRKAAGIEFPGWDPTMSNLIAEVELAEEPEWGIRRDALGIHSFGPTGSKRARAARPGWPCPEAVSAAGARALSGAGGRGEAGGVASSAPRRVVRLAVP
ncbi:FAD-dependent monooxygenase, partial [Hyalangium sp.]|uniref:FAD-dependent monooxygenase n=1 Tax=Hyalangium sp. TaxID=2028555 RepID=UPI002D629C17